MASHCFSDGRLDRSGAVYAKEEVEGIAAFADLIKAEPNESDHHLGLADAYFRRAQTKQVADGEVERLFEKPAQQIRTRSLHAEDDVDRLTRSPIPECRKRVRHIPQRYTRM